MITLSWMLEINPQLMFAATSLGTLARENKKTKVQPSAARSCDWLVTFKLLLITSFQRSTQ